MLHELEQDPAVEPEPVHRGIERLIAASETDEVRRDDAVSGGEEHRDHLAIEIGPARVAVQAEPGQRGVLRPLVEVREAQSIESRQCIGVARRPRVTGQALEAVIGCPDVRDHVGLRLRCPI